MVARTLSGLSLTAFWALGADSWKTGMDANLRILSTVANGAAQSRVTPLPGVPVLGDIYVVPSGAGSNPNEIAIWDGEVGAEAWVYIIPSVGLNIFITDEGSNIQWTGAAWVKFEAAGPDISDESTLITAGSTGINFVGGLVLVTDDGDGTTTVTIEFLDMSIAESTGLDYVLTNSDLTGEKLHKCNNAAANTLTIPAGLTGVNPVTVVQSGDGQITFVPAAGVTINSRYSYLKMDAKFGSATIIPDGTDSYILIGALTL